MWEGPGRGPGRPKRSHWTGAGEREARTAIGRVAGRGRKESQNGWTEGEAAQEHGGSNGPH